MQARGHSQHGSTQLLLTGQRHAAGQVEVLALGNQHAADQSAVGLIRMVARLYRCRIRTAHLLTVIQRESMLRLKENLSCHGSQKCFSA